MREPLLRPSGALPFWAPGTPILWRYGWRHLAAIESAWPMNVVADDEAGLVAWLPPGTPVLRPVLPDGRDLRSVGPVEMYAAGRALRRDTWNGQGSLRIAPTGAPWSVWVLRDGDGSHDGWYVNLEAPQRRDELGVISEDRVLDLVVGVDRTVRWKDVDELAGAVAAGRFTDAEAEEIVEHARRVEQLVARWGSPFADGWEHWRPDQSWPRPAPPPDLVAGY